MKIAKTFLKEVKIKAKATMGFDEENYGIDFIKGKTYKALANEDGNCYVSDTENGSGVWLSPEDLENDFEVIDVL